MPTSRARTFLVLLAVFGLFAAACSDDSDTPAAEPEAAEPEAAEPEAAEPEATEPEATEPEMALPGEGVSVTMARGS